MPIEVGVDGGVDPLISRALLERAGREDRPEAFAEVPPSLAPSSLGRMSIHHHETHGLFGGVIGGLDLRVGDEMKVTLPVEAKAMAEVLNEPVDFAVGIAAGLQDRVQCGIPDLGFAGRQGPRESLGAEFCAAVEGAEKLFEPGEQGLTVTLDGRVGEFAEVFDLADQVSQTQLDEHATVAGVFAIGAPKISPQTALEVLA